MSSRVGVLRPWSKNPLMRRGDRVAATASMLAALVALIAVPFCIVAAMTTYSSVTDRSHEAVPVTARVVSIAASDPTSPARGATVAWDQRGSRHTGTAVLPTSTKVGDSVQVWTDRNGNVTQDPAGTVERVITATWAGLLCWIGAIAVAMAGVALVHRRIARRHAGLWDQEWIQASQSNGWASH
ncbi:hypothetical protein AAFP30_28485 [Gordonia sp. CPCC 205515]|uniref:Rv1733c family protein n=1 Tax=Gordonia sp. CPCC 205515 TaxID=3140791 RepID=UPI003AF388F3